MHSEISEDLLAPMCRVYDPTKNIPSLRSPLSAVTFIFPRHKQVDRVSFFCRKVLSTAAPQSSCHEANVLTKKMCCCHAHSGVDFSLIAHVAGAGCCLSLWPPEAVLLLFFCFDETILSVTHQHGATLILLSVVSAR